MTEENLTERTANNPELNQPHEEILNLFQIALNRAKQIAEKYSKEKEQSDSKEKDNSKL